MSQAKQLEELLQEFARVGVDPNTISAGLGVSRQDALRVLATLPNGAGPAAFLRQLREVMTHAAGVSDKPEHDTKV